MSLVGRSRNTLDERVVNMSVDNPNVQRPAHAGKRMMMLRRTNWLLAAGLCALAAQCARAEVFNYTLGQERSYRWNDQRTGFGFDPADSSFSGLPSNQMPSLSITKTDTKGKEYEAMTPDLNWIYPLDVEGADLDNAGNQYPIGYTLGSIHSSPTVAGIETATQYTLSVMFGSTTTVQRHLRNTLPPKTDATGAADPSDGRGGDYWVNGTYNQTADPYGYLENQITGCVFALDGLSGTTESLDSNLGYEDYVRKNQPFWWWGVRNLPYYTSLDTEAPDSSDTRTFENSPSLQAHRLFINASDSLVRAFDYGPWETRATQWSSDELPYAAEPARDSTKEPWAQPIGRREALLSRYLAPSVKSTEDPDTGAGINSGAGVVGAGRPDIPERLTDRLYNLSIRDPKYAVFGLYANRDNIQGKDKDTLGDAQTNVPLDNRFRLQSGMGAINSTGVFVHLANAITYTSRFYAYDTNLDNVRIDRRNPGKIIEQKDIVTDQLYIVGSDDGYVYAFDARPDNARRVPASGGTSQTSTWVGRLVWAFRAAVRAPMYHSAGSDSKPLTVDSVASGETAGSASTDKGGDYIHLKGDGALVAPNAAIITGPVSSSPVSCDVALNSTAFSHPNQTRTVVIFGTSIGRLFCLDAATGMEEWEFKTTPLGQTRVHVGSKIVNVDGVTGAAILTSPALGFVAGATSQANPSAASTGRLGVFFGADDGKVYALDAADGSPLREGTNAGWDVSGQLATGTAGQPDRALLDHFGFVTYPFERGTTSLPGTDYEDKYGRVIPAQWGSKHLTASVVARPSAAAAYTQPLHPDATIPGVDAIFISSPTNQADASTSNEPAFTGGTIWCVNPLNGKVKWTFDRFHDVRRAVNSNFDKNTSTDYTIRPGAFHVTPAYACNIQIFDEDKEGASSLPGNHDGEKDPLKNQNVLFAIDDAGRLFALKTDDNLASVDRLYWRLPYPLTSGVGQSGNLYSTPVVTTPNGSTGNTNSLGLSLDGRSYVYIGTPDGIEAIDTTAMRNSPITNTDNELLPAATRYTGGEMTWGWQTPRDSWVEDTTSSTSTVSYVVTSDPKPVVTTPAIHYGTVYAGSDNGLLYAWAHNSSLLDGFGFNNTGGGKYTGYNRPRRPLPPGNRPSGGGITQATKEFFVDIFQAGFQYSPGFTVSGVKSISPSGAPAGSDEATKNGAALTSPAPLGQDTADFKATAGAMLEWGDPIVVAAWGPALTSVKTNSIDDRGTVTFQLTGPNTSASLKALIEDDGIARQVFYLDPFTRRTPNTLLYPNSPRNQVVNPLAGQTLPPGQRAPYFTVTGYFQPTDAVVEDSRNPGSTVTIKQPQQRIRINALTRFHLANPINLITKRDTLVPTTATGANATTYPDLDRNGNFQVVPVVPAVVGDHGVNTTPQAQAQVQVVDRSHLPKLRALSGSDSIALRVKVQPARLRWMGGPASCYKPMFYAANRSKYPNTWGLRTPPEPLYVDAAQWTDRIAGFYATTDATGFIGAEQPPYLDGEENKSADYPDIDARTSAWMALPQRSGDAEQDASASEVAILGGSSNPFARIYLRVAVPKYQPANYVPDGVNPSNRPGYGPGYYSVNPANSTAYQSALYGLNGSWGKRYSADVNDTSLQYMGPSRMLMPVTNTFVAQEVNYLTKVYADVNGNGTADIDSGEAYRMFVSGAEVRPAESMRVTSGTIDIPRSPETAVPGGYIPFGYYYDHQTAVAGANPVAADPYLYGERNFFTPISIYNNGNVNLWNLRVDKFDPFAGHLTAPGVDENYLFDADPMSNWPATGVLRRYNISSTLDALPISANRPGGAGDPDLWTPALKPRPGGLSDEGEGRIIQVRDVFPFTSDGYKPRSRTTAFGASYLTTAAGLPYLTVAVPPGTPPGRYSTPQGRLVVFEDSGGSVYGNGRAYNGVLDVDSKGNPIESGTMSDAVLSVNVSETRLTDKVAQMPPFLPNADSGVAFAAKFRGAPTSMADLERIWQTLAQDTTPSAYRDPVTGDLVAFWSSNRVWVGKSAIPGLTATDNVTDQYRVFATSMRWDDPDNPPIRNTADVEQFLTGTLAKDPWGWSYRGGNSGSFYFPTFDEARWFGEPTVSPWMPEADKVNTALGLDPNTVTGADLNYTSPAPITNFHGTQFPPVVFWTGTVGIGSEARSAIFYAPVEVNRATGEVTTNSANVQAVGVLNGRRTLDPFTPKYGPRPFLITAGGDLTATGRLAPTARLTNERVIGLGVAWFGGAPGAWKLYVSTIETDDSGNVASDAVWNTTQLALPSGVVSALHPSVYYHQWPTTLKDSDGKEYRQGTIEVAFTGYSRAGRNPDIYVARYIAMKSDANGANASVSNFAAMGFARKGGDPSDIAHKPLEPLMRMAGEPRPVYHSHWVNWLGRRNLGTVIYWFQKPVSGSSRDYNLYATFTARRPGGNNANVVEVQGRLANGDVLPDITAFVNAASGTVRFTTTDPVNHPAPMTRSHLFDGVTVQDYLYVAMNPYALRVTADDAMSDSMPQIWLDESHEVLGTDRQGDTNFDITAGSPLEYRRDRLWVLWRRGAAPEGATKSSTLFYTTYRLGVDLGQDLTKTGVPADVRIPLKNKKPDIELTDSQGAKIDTVFIVDRDKGRIYFTEANDGDQVRVKVAGVDRGLFTIGWLPENVRSATTYSTDVTGTFRLPSIQAVEPLAVPTQGQGNDAMPWIFKDPWSDIPVADSNYYRRTNNNMWLFWTSTRASRAFGNTKSSPVPPDVTKQIDPFYYDTTTNSLNYAASASDVYFTSISPDFTK